MSDASSYDLSVTRHINAPPAKVWEIMTTRIPEWWCPRPWRSEVERLDARPGGAMQINMFGPDGEEERIPGLILAWDEGRRFAFTDAIQGDLRPSGPFMIGVFEIAPEDGGTRYTASARHWTSEAMEQHRSMGFAEGWGAVAAQLAEICETETV